MNISLRYKLLAILILIPVVSLMVYLWIAISEFKKDKLAYVYDSSAAVAYSLATQVRSELDNFIERVRPIAEHYDHIEKRFNVEAEKLFLKADRIDSIIFFKKGERGKYHVVADLSRDTDYGNEFKEAFKVWGPLHDRVVSDRLAISSLKDFNMHIAVGITIGDLSSADHMVAVGMYRAQQLKKSIVDSSLYANILFSKSGAVELASQQMDNYKLVIEKIVASQVPQGSLEVQSEKELLVGFADVGVAGLKVAAIVDKQVALRTVEKLIIKSFIVLVAIMAVTVILGLIASVGLTSHLRELYEATRKISQGDFKVRVNADSNDEVGGLAEGFNSMASEVSRLLEETREKARMESELETVRLVQENLMPKARETVGQFRVVGHFEPASECGGDWWHYCQIGEKLYIWIGDATGHGAPAAMVTGSAKSAATIVEMLNETSPGKMLEIVNKVIHSTTKGKIMMTFFIGALDLKTGEMIYANASHEPPYLLKKTNDKFTKKHLEAIMSVNGPRLGDNPNTKYEEGKIQINPGDAILCYTDGITDLMSPEGKAWGERGFVRSIVEIAAHKTADERMDSLAELIKKYRGNAKLIDDITLMVCQFDNKDAA